MADSLLKIASIGLLSRRGRLRLDRVVVVSGQLGRGYFIIIVISRGYRFISGNGHVLYRVLVGAVLAVRDGGNRVYFGLGLVVAEAPHRVRVGAGKGHGVVGGGRV